MPNIKSQIKRDKTNEKARAINASRRSEFRTAIKKVETLVQEGKKDEALVALRSAQALLDKAAQDGVITANSSARKKAHLEKIVK